MAPEKTLAHRLALIVITDSAARIGTLAAVTEALRAGAPTIQLRWKQGSARELFDVGTSIREATRSAGALFFLNDRLDVALALGADGLHLGDDDLPLVVARRIAPPPFLIGRSVDTPEEALAAAAAGADYVGAGPLYPTATKLDTGPVLGPAKLREICAVAEIPVIAIGGIGPGGAAAAIDAGASGVSVLGAVMSSPNPASIVTSLMGEIEAAAQRR